VLPVIIKRLTYNSGDNIKDCVGDGDEEEKDFSRVFHIGLVLAVVECIEIRTPVAYNYFMPGKSF